MIEASKEIYRIINGSKTSVSRDSKNNTIIKDSTHFKGLPMDRIPLITDIQLNAMKQSLTAGQQKFMSLDQVREQSYRRTFDTAVSLFKGKVKAGNSGVLDSIYNSITGVNTGHDPTLGGDVAPNIWISPYEANALYSQKGLPEIIINKKSKSILLNGLKIKNKKLSAKQIDTISLSMMALNVPKTISDSVRDALVYGGSLVFPMFHGDSPVTTNMSIVGLIKTGILKKNSIDYLISLDRWNVMHLPATNPTQRDFLLPEKYYIPFLGSDVHGSRCSRIVTGAQAGYWGQVMTLGWGLSDFCGYVREVYNYKNSVQVLPMMLQQMSILARTINIDGIIAQEGPAVLEEMQMQNTIKTTEWSMDNPITLDMLGELKVINRDFAEVPNLLRLLRQDLAASATLPEPMLFSSEKGNFSSGDDTQGNLSKQYEAVKFIHKDVETQFKQLAKILIINALGSSKEILECLPYTEIHFDTPVIANSVERAEIGLNQAKAYFELVAGQMPLDKAAEIMSSFGGDEMSIDSDLLASLKERQDKSDAANEEKKKVELELLVEQVKQAQYQNENSEAASPSASGVPKPKKEAEGYTKLEQEQKSKSRMPGEKRPEQLAKRQ